MMDFLHFYLLFMIKCTNLTNIRTLCQVATKDNSSADLQQSRLQQQGKKTLKPLPLKLVGFLSEVRAAIVPLRCLIDRGSVKPDSLFCSLLGDLPCHVSTVLRSR